MFDLLKEEIKELDNLESLTVEEYYLLLAKKIIKKMQNDDIFASHIAYLAEKFDRKSINNLVDFANSPFNKKQGNMSIDEIINQVFGEAFYCEGSEKLFNKLFSLKYEEKELETNDVVAEI